jgi:hypothetical protein
MFTSGYGLGFLLLGAPLPLYHMPHLLLLAWRWRQPQLLSLGFSSITLLARLLLQLLQGVVVMVGGKRRRAQAHGVDVKEQI